MRKLLMSCVLACTVLAGWSTAAFAGTAVSSRYTHADDYQLMHDGAQESGLSDSAFQKNAVAGVAYLFAITGTTNVNVPTPPGGDHPISTNYNAGELNWLDDVADVMNLSRSNAQKVSALFVAFLLALS
jgi:hypothetical protein